LTDNTMAVQVNEISLDDVCSTSDRLSGEKTTEAESDVIPTIANESAETIETEGQSSQCDRTTGSRVGVRRWSLQSSFTLLARQVINITSNGAVRLRKHYLDRCSLEISNDLLGRSGTCEVFRGRLEGQPVAVKRLQLDSIRRDCSKKELKDLLTEIDLLCRFLI
jgi:hypothetical protein